MHQLVEHAIGAAKGHVSRVLGKARVNNKRLTTKLGYTAMQEGCTLYNKVSWERNWWRLCDCLFLIGARKGAEVQLWRRLSSQNCRREVQKGLAGQNCYTQRS